jgi:hypothetical protein
VPSSDQASSGPFDATALIQPAPDEVVATLAYALRHDERGRPQRGATAGWDFTSGIAAQHLANHLERAGFVVLRRRPRTAHMAG